jgi:hypothetical protein
VILQFLTQISVYGALMCHDDSDVSFNNIAGEIPPTLPPNVEYLYILLAFFCLPSLCFVKYI